MHTYIQALYTDIKNHCLCQYLCGRLCFITDPFIQERSKWACGNCQDFDYMHYLSQDPIYKNMSLWLKDEPPSGVCAGCTGNCSIVQPTLTKPCYEGTPEDTTTCYNTDPILEEGSQWFCGSCTQFGFPYYLMPDPIYPSMSLWTSELPPSVCTGCAGNCSIVQPTISKPCYQGLPDDVALCYNTDPILEDGSKWYCGNCEDYDHPYYLMQDPIYSAMALYMNKPPHEELKA